MMVGAWDVVVQVPSVEGVLNALTEAEIAFFSPQPLDGVTLSVQIPYGQMGRARKIMEAQGGEIRLCRLWGMLPRLNRAKRRVGLLVALSLCLLLLGLSNFFVWRIDVSGNETVTTGSVLRAMENAGAGIGSFWPSFGAERLQNRLLMELPEVQWVGVNYSSGAVKVVLREKREVPTVVDNDMPVQIVSAAEGVVMSVSAKQGQAMVNVGDAVERGQVLISGTPADAQGGVRNVHALGSVKGRTSYVMSVRVPVERREKRYIGRRHLKISLILGRDRINFYPYSSIFGDTCDTITMDYRLCMQGVFSLPVRLLVQQWVDWTPTTYEADLQDANIQAQEVLRMQLRQKLEDRGDMVTEEFASAATEDCLTVTMVAECVEELGVEEPLAAGNPIAQ